MRTGPRPYRSRSIQKFWEVADSTLLHDERRALFGEERYLKEYMLMGVFDDVFSQVKSTANGRALEDPKFEERFPTLYTLLTHLQDEKGQPRQVCTMTLVCEDGVAKVGINERNHHLSLWVSATGIGEAFQRLEEALQERPVAWRKAPRKGRY